MNAAVSEGLCSPNYDPVGKGTEAEFDTGGPHLLSSVAHHGTDASLCSSGDTAALYPVADSFEQQMQPALPQAVGPFPVRGLEQLAQEYSDMVFGEEVLSTDPLSHAAGTAKTQNAWSQQDAHNHVLAARNTDPQDEAVAETPADAEYSADKDPRQEQSLNQIMMGGAADQSQLECTEELPSDWLAIEPAASTLSSAPQERTHGRALSRFAPEPARSLQMGRSSKKGPEGPPQAPLILLNKRNDTAQHKDPTPAPNRAPNLHQTGKAAAALKAQDSLTGEAASEAHGESVAMEGRTGSPKLPHRLPDAPPPVDSALLKSVSASESLAGSDMSSFLDGSDTLAASFASSEAMTAPPEGPALATLQFSKLAQNVLPQRSQMGASQLHCCSLDASLDAAPSSARPLAAVEEQAGDPQSEQVPNTAATVGCLQDKGSGGFTSRLRQPASTRLPRQDPAGPTQLK